MADGQYYQTATDDHSAMLADVFDLPTPEAQNSGEETSPSEPAVSSPGEGVVAPSPSPEPAGEPSPAAQPSGQPSPAQAPAAPTPPPAPATPPAGYVSQADFDALVAQINAQPQQAPAAQGGQQPPSGAADVVLADEAIDYKPLTVPDNVVEAIFSEDPAQTKAGLNALVQGLSTMLHTRLRAENMDSLKRMSDARDVARQTRAEERTQADTARSMQEQFYGKFPALNNAAARQVVVAANSAMMAENPTQVWDDNYIAALGARAQQMLRTAAGLPAEPVPAAPPTALPPKAPAAFAPQGARAPGSTSAAPSVSDEVNDLFNDT